jgi:hypothetical protein
MIPKFDKRGNLPAGKPYKATWEQFVDHFGYNERRETLLAGMILALYNLKEAGCKRVYIDGSFITTKKNSSDWDGCWEIEGVDFDRLDSVIADEKFHHEERKEKYLGDLFLHSPRLPGAHWVNRFQKDRDGKAKGIVVIELETLP